MSFDLSIFHRYLSAQEANTAWGIHLTDIGATRVPPAHPYPPSKHPDAYTLNHATGRVLDIYQVIYITRGEGTFWSEKSDTCRIHQGTLFLLFPGVRHRYRPDPSTGWDEHWIGFSGPGADGFVSAKFTPENAVHQIGVHPDMELLFEECCDLIRHESYGFRERASLKLMEIVVNAHLKIHSQKLTQSPYDSLIRKACSQMIEYIDAPFDSNEFSLSNGVSHTSFRRHFKAKAGMSPVQYLLDLRIKKAKRLIMETVLPINNIAEECGFDNPLYFSRLFKQRVGVSPLNKRKEIHNSQYMLKPNLDPII